MDASLFREAQLELINLSSFISELFEKWDYSFKIRKKMILLFSETIKIL